ncbi:hypothetical protein OSTOST_11585 [Ostertagia ostertagi]
MCITAGIFGAARLRKKHRHQFLTRNLPWIVEQASTREILPSCRLGKPLGRNNTRASGASWSHCVSSSILESCPIVLSRFH